MSLILAAGFAPVYAALPGYLRQSAPGISPRFPRPGGSTGGQTIGTNGSTTTYTPIRSALEAQAWGASLALWSYTDLAASYGYASPAAFVGEFTAAGIPIQATTNTRAANPSTGPFMQDAGGSNWSAGSSPDRPLVGGLPQSPTKSRIAITIDYMPAADAGTQSAKLAGIAAQMSAGCFGLHMDDPRGGAAYSHWPGIVQPYDLVGQGADFSPSSRAGFTTWLTANTTTTQRTDIGLPSSLAGFDFLTHLTTNYPSIMFTPGQDNGALVDNYRFRTTAGSNTAVREQLKLFGRFLRDDHASYVQAVRTQLAGAPLSLNYWNANPQEYISWHARRSPKLWDFAVAETAPPYWAALSPHAIGSSAWQDARNVQCARQHLNATACDMSGLRAWFEHKPTALNQAPARVVVQIMRQSMMQTVMEGHGVVMPIDVFMTTNDGSNDQGVTVDGYRYWGSVADFGDIPTFIKANASLIDGYEKCATVHLAVHGDSFPFFDGSQAPRFQTLMQRLAELWRRDVDYHFLPVGAADGLLPQDPVRSVELNAPIIIRLQDDADYYTHLGRLSGPRCRAWSTRAADEAMGHSPVRSTNQFVRATARYNAAAKRVSVHLHNYAINSDGTPSPQTTTLIWNWGGAGSAIVRRLGEADANIQFDPKGAAQISLNEYAIVNFAVG